MRRVVGKQLSALEHALSMPREEAGQGAGSGEQGQGRGARGEGRRSHLMHCIRCRAI